MNKDLSDKIAEETGFQKTEVLKIIDCLFLGLHKRFYECDGDYIGDQAIWDLGDRAFYHFLGMLEQFSEKYNWDKGSISEYLGRMPPCERWQELRKEMAGWEYKR